MSRESETRHLYGRAMGVGLAGLAGLAAEGLLPATAEAGTRHGGWDLATNKKAVYEQPDPSSSYKFGVSIGSGDIDADGDGVFDIMTSSIGGDDGSISFWKFSPTELSIHKHFRPAVFDDSVDTRVAIADLDRDGLADMCIVAGEGSSSSMSVVSYEKFRPEFSPFSSSTAFTQKLTNGVHVAAGDVNGDGFAECIVSSSASESVSGLPSEPSSFHEVTAENITQPNDGQLTAFLKHKDPFYAYGQNYSGGIRIAVGDIDGDESADVITLNEEGSSRVARIHKHSPDLGWNRMVEFDLDLSSGLPDGSSRSVAAGDVDGDGRAELAVGAGMGESPVVSLWTYVDSPPGPEGVIPGWTLMNSYQVFDSSYLGGVNVGLSDFTGDGLADLSFGMAMLVPEPSVAMVVCAAGVLMGRRRRRLNGAS